MMSTLFRTIFCFLPISTTLATAESHHMNNPYEVPVTNDLAHQRYNISISVGNPAQTFPLLLDTGSSDIWFPQSNSSGCAPNCPAGFDLTTSSSIINTTIPYDARYGLTPDLAVLGTYYNDSISVGNAPPILNAQFAVANVPYLLFRQGNWGIFGLGSRIQEAVYSGPTSPFRGNYSATYTPVWERLAFAATGKRKYSVWLNAQNATTGSVEFGGSGDASKYSGELKRVPLNLENGQRYGWNVNLSSVVRVLPSEGGGCEKENKKPLTPRNYSMDYTIDSGSPNMYVPSTLYNSIIEGLNATEPLNEASYVPCKLRTSASGFLDFTFLAVPNLQERRNISTGKVTIRVPLSEIIYPYGYPMTWPLVPDRNGEKMCYFGIVATDGPIRILGATFIRSAYMIFDGDSQEVSMAQAKWHV